MADGVNDEGETLVGASYDLLTFAVELTKGFQKYYPESAPGWNVIVFDIYDMGRGPTSATSLTSPHAVQLDANLLVTGRESLDGRIIPALDGTVAVDLYQYGVNPSLATHDLTLLSTTVDATKANATFAFGELPLPAPEALASELFGDDDVENGVRFAVYSALAYEDMDGNGQYDWESEIALASSLEGSEPRFIVWSQPLTFAAVAPATAWGGMGWQMIEPAKSPIPTAGDWNDGLVLDGIAGR